MSFYAAQLSSLSLPTTATKSAFTGTSSNIDMSGFVDRIVALVVTEAAHVRACSGASDTVTTSNGIPLAADTVYTFRVDANNTRLAIIAASTSGDLFVAGVS